MNRARIEELDKLASDAKRVGDYHSSLRWRTELERVLEDVGEDPAEQALNLNSLAYVAVCAGLLEVAERAARKSLEVHCSFTSEESPRFATYLMMLSRVLAEQAKFDEAVLLGERAIEIHRRLLGEENLHVQGTALDVQAMRNKEHRQYLGRHTPIVPRHSPTTPN